MHKAFRYRLEPTAEQEQKLRQFAGSRRFIWNWALQQRREYYHQTGRTLPARELSARLTALKDQPETAWLKDMHAQSLQQVLTDLQRAFSNFFDRRARYPRFKSRKRDTPRFRMPQDVRVVGKYIKVPKVGLVRLRLHQPIVGTTRSATFRQDACGHWHVTLVSAIETPDVVLPLPQVEQTVGVDLGLKDIMTVTSTRPSTSETKAGASSPWDTRRVKTLVDGT
jgi:putative transposase